MACKPFLLQFDPEPTAVLTPTHEELSYHFAKKALMCFVTAAALEQFLATQNYRIVGRFENITLQINIYELEVGLTKITICQAPLGAAAAVQLLEWLHAYGVQQVLAFGTAGVLTELPENKILLPIKALRDEGTSYHYLPAGDFVELNQNWLQQITSALAKFNISYQEVTTWTTDGFFRETPGKVLQAKELGAVTVEMECAALAACAKFRKIDFAELLFTADSLADLTNHDNRSWGSASYQVGFEVGVKVLSNV